MTMHRLAAIKTAAALAASAVTRPEPAAALSDDRHAPADRLLDAAPFAELADPAGDYEFSIKLDVALNDYADGIARQRVVEARYAVSGGRFAGVGRLVVEPIVGQEASDAGEWEDVYGEPVVALTGTDPLPLLRAMLSGGTA